MDKLTDNETIRTGTNKFQITAKYFSGTALTGGSVNVQASQMVRYRPFFVSDTINANFFFFFFFYCH
jgi:hypothetical protein